MKKIFILILTLCILAVSVMPAFATEADTAVVMSTPDQIEPSSRVDEFFGLYTALENAMNSGDINALKTAVDNFMLYSENMEDSFTDEEIAELEVLFGTDVWEALGLMIDIAINADGIIALDDAYNAFKADPSSATAVGVVVLYEEILDYEDDEFLADVKRFFPDIEDVYAQASALLPSPRVYGLYRAHQNMLTAFEWGDIYFLEEAVYDFRTTYNGNELTKQQLDELAQLYLMTVEEVTAMMADDYAKATVLLELDRIINEYYVEPTTETAQALVDQYNAIADEELLKLVDLFFFDFEEVYNDAKAYLGEEVDDDTEDETKEPQKAPQSTKDEASSKTNTAPVKTGNSTVAVVAVLSMFLMLFAIGVMKKRVR